MANTANRRIELHEKLVNLLGSNHVYFQPPESIKLSYPCIIYSRNSINMEYADDDVYNFEKSYQITIIDKNPDSELIDKMTETFNKIRFNRHFTSDNLNHDVFILFY